MTEDSNPPSDTTEAPSSLAEASAAAEAPPAAEEAEARPAPPTVAADKLPEPEEGDDSGKKGFFAKLNPLTLFTKDTPKSMVKRGRVLMENRNFAQATIAFKRALELDSEFTPAYEAIGDVLMKKGGRSNVTAAIEQFREAVVRNPLSEKAYANMAKAFDMLGKRKEAALEKKKLVVVKTLDRDPENPIANNNMGILFLQQKQVDTALEYFGRAVKSNPTYDTGFRNMALTYYRLATEAEDPAKCESYLEKAKPNIVKALEVAESPLSLMAHARILIMEENYEDALVSCERAEKIDPALKDVFGVKKNILLKLNRLEEANTAFETYRYLNNNE